MTLCVYALVTGTARVSGTGMSGERLRLLRAGRVGAVIGELAGPPGGSVEHLRRYDQVVRVLSERQAAILPTRFGTCFDDPDELRFILRSRRQALQRALRHVRGRVQMTVRLIGTQSSSDEAQGRRPAVNVRPAADVSPDAMLARQQRARKSLAAPTVGAGTAFLRGRAESAARARRVPGFEPMQAAVGRWVRDERVERRAGVTTVYHLIPRRSAGPYQRALVRAAGVVDRRLHVTGPWPPYAFVEVW